jgi:hypothetical protein
MSGNRGDDDGKPYTIFLGIIGRPSVPVGSAICPRPKRRLGQVFSSSLARNEAGCVVHPHRDHAEEEDALLAQLRLPLATRSKRIAPDKRILYPAPHSLPYASGRGTDVPSSQYREPLNFFRGYLM